MVRARLQQKDLLAALVEAGKPGIGTHADELAFIPAPNSSTPRTVTGAPDAPP